MISHKVCHTRREWTDIDEQYHHAGMPSGINTQCNVGGMPSC